jgi:hypothetical protein
MKKIKTCYNGKKTLITLACGKIKLVLKEKGPKLPIQKKTVARRAFSVFPK